MKKILFIVIFALFLNNNAFATDACDEFIPVEQSFYWKVTMVARLRDYPCISKSTIIWSSTLWETYNIVRKVDWWYEVKFDNWNTAWIRDQAVTKLYDYENNSIIKDNNQNNNIENTENSTTENNSTSWYSLTYKDKIIINKIINKINLNVKEKWFEYKDNILIKLENIVLNYELNPRLKAIFNELIIRVKDIKEKSEVEENKVTIQENTKLSSYNIDFDKVKEVWLWRYNTERESLWKKDYIYNSKLEETAFEWSEISKNKWVLDHRRDSWDAYYNYSKIANWFSDRWIVCENLYKVTFSENISQWIYSCSDWECTDEFIKWVKSSFDFFMSEKTKTYQPHYQSLINDYFKEIWLWISIIKQSETKYKYFLTVHYCTEIVEK